MKKKITILMIVALALIYSAKAQVYFNENFNEGIPEGWTLIDKDGDGYNWGVEDFSLFEPELGKGSLFSHSYYGDPITPDNIITSNLIDLTTISPDNLTLKYIELSNPNYPGDRYNVYITTVNNIDSILASTPVYEKVVSGGTNEVVINISNFAGKKIYISFRHFESTDFDFVGIDDMMISKNVSYDVDLYKATLDLYGELNSKHAIELQVKNKGSITVSNLEITWNDGVEHITNIPIDIPTGAKAIFVLPDSIYSNILETKNITLSITQINGNPDANPVNNSTSLSYSTYSQKGTKRVLVEEATGSWCGFCVRGIVALDLMVKKYPDTFIPIAVHGYDPMEVPTYPVLGGFQSFPSMTVDREWKHIDISPSDIDSVYQKRIETTASPLDIEITASFSGNALTITPKAKFYFNNPNADLRFAVVMTEDNVHNPTDTLYNQHNYYSGGSLGEMGGFEKLPEVILANDMYYQHVAQALLGGYYGQENSIPTNIQNNSTAEYQFSYVIPDGHNPKNYTANVFVVDTKSGRVLNARHYSFNYLGKEEQAANHIEFKVFPNPASQAVNINYAQKGEYLLQVVSSGGRIVKSQKCTINDDNQIINLPIQDLANGNYLITLSGNGHSISKKIIVLH